MKKAGVTIAIVMYAAYLAVSAWGVLNFGQEIKDVMQDKNHWRRQK